MFTIINELDSGATIHREFENHVYAALSYITLVEQFLVSLDKEAKFEWFDLAEVNKIIVLDLNKAIVYLKFENRSVIVEDLFKKQKRIETAGDVLAKAIAIEEYKGCNKMVESDGGYDAEK